MVEMVDPRQLSLVELRALRAKLQNDDDAVSYVRRLAQARLDLVQAEKRRRATGGEESLSDELPAILSTHCDSVQAALLLELGRWTDAEELIGSVFGAE